MSKASKILESLSKLKINESSKSWYNNLDKWREDIAKLDVTDDDTYWAKYEGTLIAKWYEDRNEGWIDTNSLKV